MATIFTNLDLFRIIYEYTDLRSFCDTCRSFATCLLYTSDAADE